MKILQLINSADTGGAQTLVEALAARLTPAHDVHVVVLMGEDVLSQRLANASTSVRHLGMSRRSMRIDSAVATVGRIVRDVRADVVHSHLFQADLVNALVPGKHARISTVHTTGMTGSDPLRSRAIAASVARIAGTRFDANVACGPAALRYMRATGYRGRTTVIRNGVPVDGDAPGERPRSHRVLCLSRWHPMKDHGTLLDAFVRVAARVADAHLVLAGSGVDAGNAELSGMIEARGLSGRVECLGPVRDVSMLLRSSDALVISSAYGEALPMAGAEAIAAGLPVVTTDVGDSRDLAVDPGHVVQPSDPVALADALVSVLGVTDDERRALSRRAWLQARDAFSIERTTSAYADLYASVNGQTA